MPEQVVNLKEEEKARFVKYEEVSWNRFSSDSVEANGREKTDKIDVCLLVLRYSQYSRVGREKNQHPSNGSEFSGK